MTRSRAKKHDNVLQGRQRRVLRLPALYLSPEARRN